MKPELGIQAKVGSPASRRNDLYVTAGRNPTLPLPAGSVHARL